MNYAQIQEAFETEKNAGLPSFMKTRLHAARKEADAEKRSLEETRSPRKIRESPPPAWARDMHKDDTLTPAKLRFLAHRAGQEAGAHLAGGSARSSEGLDRAYQAVAKAKKQGRALKQEYREQLNVRERAPSNTKRAQDQKATPTESPARRRREVSVAPGKHQFGQQDRPREAQRGRFRRSSRKYQGYTPSGDFKKVLEKAKTAAPRMPSSSTAVATTSPQGYTPSDAFRQVLEKAKTDAVSQRKTSSSPAPKRATTTPPFRSDGLSVSERTGAITDTALKSLQERQARIQQQPLSSERVARRKKILANLGSRKEGFTKAKAEVRKTAPSVSAATAKAPAVEKPTWGGDFRKLVGWVRSKFKGGSPLSVGVPGSHSPPSASPLRRPVMV